MSTTADSPLETPRLLLVRDTPEMVRAMKHGQPAFESLIGYRVADGIMDFSQGMSPERVRALESGEANPWLYGLWAIHKADGVVIGAGGFRAPPDANGVVEIAYGIVSGYQGQGYATEVAGALVQFSFRDPSVRSLCAHTLPEDNASTRVLLKSGFHKSGEIIDPEDGSVWNWELARPSALTLPPQS